jgi:tetratricopeptide (TPR) repeat protein
LFNGRHLDLAAQLVYDSGHMLRRRAEGSCPLPGGRNPQWPGRVPAALLLLLVLAAIPAASLADEIYLKNGRKITGAVVREDAREVVYDVGGGEFTIPRSLVDHVGRSATPMPTTPPRADLRARPAAEVPLPAPQPLDTSGEASTLVVKNQAVDESQLARLDDDVLRSPTDENRYRLALGYREAGSFLAQSGKPEEAIELYRHALHFAPADLNLTLALAYLLVTEKHFSAAVDLLNQAEAQFPNSSDVPLLLGSAYYYTENLSRAIEAWKQSLALRDDPRVREALARAEQEQKVAGSYQEMRSLHFLIRYQGADAQPLAQQVRDTLEGDFTELESDLDIYPGDTIVVLLYPDQAFRDVTRLPTWAGAVNDGKIRVPVSGLVSMTPDLARVLRHELTHSFVHQATLGQCPVWFNEGLAQFEERTPHVTASVQLARAFAKNQTIPFDDLEGSFLELPQDKVGMAYAKSLAAVEYLRDTYGMPEIRRLLKLMATHPDFSSLLQDELRLTYPTLEQDVAAYIQKRYGS